MNSNDERNEAFSKQAKALFDDSVEGLDGATQSALNQGRQRALEAASKASPGYGRWTQLVPAAGFAAAAVVAVVVWNGVPQSPSELAAPVDDLEILMTEDSFEMLEELEFYSWLDMEGDVDGELNMDADVG